MCFEVVERRDTGLEVEFRMVSGLRFDEPAVGGRELGRDVGREPDPKISPGG